MFALITCTARDYHCMQCIMLTHSRRNRGRRIYTIHAYVIFFKVLGSLSLSGAHVLCCCFFSWNVIIEPMQLCVWLLHIFFANKKDNRHTVRLSRLITCITTTPCTLAISSKFSQNQNCSLWYALEYNDTKWKIASKIATGIVHELNFGPYCCHLHYFRVQLQANNPFN